MNMLLKDLTPVTFNLRPVQPLTLVPPYVNESDMREIRDFFNAEYSTQPWGQVHDGLDVYPNGDLKPFQSACAGRVNRIFVADEQVSVFINCDSMYSLGYHFESQAPATGQIQRANITVTEGQLVSQGHLIGYLYSAENPPRAHVHFSLYRHSIPSCPEPYFSPADQGSILNLISVAHSQVLMCSSGDVTSPPIITPFVNQSDMAVIKAGFSSQYSTSPWGYAHDGFDIYPRGDLKPFRASCPGIVDTIELRRSQAGSGWQVRVVINCNDFVYDPKDSGYFIPLSLEYLFETHSHRPADGQAQLDNVLVVPGQQVSQGEVIAYLNVFDEGAHLQFSLLQFGSSEFTIFGAQPIPVCPEVHFTADSRDSMLNLLQASWPTASMCYQN